MRDVRIFQTAMVLTTITIALGSMVCATDSSSACPAWPACYADQIGPEVQGGWLENPIIEFVHRAISFACLVFLGVAGWVGRKSSDPRIRILPWVALGCAIGSAVFGMMIILFTLPLGLSLLDLGFAFIAMVLITISTQAVSGRTSPTVVPRVRNGAAAALATLVPMHLLGSVVAGTVDGHASFTRCVSWPLWMILDNDRLPGLQWVRIVLAVIAIVVIALTVLWAVRVPLLRVPALLLGGLLMLELALGALIRFQGLSLGQTNGIEASLAIAYAVAAVGILWAAAWLLGRSLPSAGSVG